jgi:hypothetical protein
MRKALFFALLLFPVLVLAQAASPTPAAAVSQAVNALPVWAPPQWVIDILTWVQTLPVVGPYVVKGLSWLTTLCMLATVLATFVMGLLKGLSGSANLVSAIPALAKLSPIADKIDSLYEKVVPYLQYFSMYNSNLANKTPPTPSASPTT